MNNNKISSIQLLIKVGLEYERLNQAITKDGRMQRSDVYTAEKPSDAWHVYGQVFWPLFRTSPIFTIHQHVINPNEKPNEKSIN